VTTPLLSATSVFLTASVTTGEIVKLPVPEGG
jgi:hypothetical protein